MRFWDGFHSLENCLQLNVELLDKELIQAETCRGSYSLGPHPLSWKNGSRLPFGAVAQQRRLAMKDFRPSLACFLIVLGQLCLNCELNFNLTVDFSLELSAVLTLVGVVALTIRK